MTPDEEKILLENFVNLQLLVTQNTQEIKNLIKTNAELDIQIQLLKGKVNK